ncbi:organic hydroperoxide resistance protein [Salisediminibacterium halotolerans]|uniref:Peroxiredoxin, Ohr subfamily n=1 Tax=Salisediminibacterium halotolerans TaxID=517425 RepID=A0A1H9RQ11_9BACI|nr:MULTISPECIES: organic hydroperoxide resistance protein [Salisediminibacterium]RLJ81021.1 Ohr subfamily peroxiredoxin [Actinophytocola xinjiangensis]RPE87889.1 Ohr subfamily peroxiredoxin [Salisediminibacterium halotolerans]TWG37914.1 Ohr subfamily peroxiredoxin [Salisediminibacterium halotolerans]SER74203.1 peroxiredoxin, Ohr subfamily [Salisediminibacterium haloalkalitolerans]GEL08335.1 organic hydroperoxide resistance protein OhrB [Salisediminibacterium halotolerans]
MADKVLTTSATATGGREGHVKSDNGVIDLDLSMPKGDNIPSDKTNPEQLFAAGYAACYDGALNLMASNEKKDIESTLTSEVSLIKDPTDNGFKIGVTMHVEIKGVSQEEAESLAQKAHDFCPYSKATRGNIDVDLHVTAK